MFLTVFQKSVKLLHTMLPCRICKTLRLHLCFKNCSFSIFREQKNFCGILLLGVVRRISGRMLTLQSSSTTNRFLEFSSSTSSTFIQHTRISHLIHFFFWWTFCCILDRDPITVPLLLQTLHQWTVIKTQQMVHFKVSSKWTELIDLHKQSSPYVTKETDRPNPGPFVIIAILSMKILKRLVKTMCGVKVYRPFSDGFQLI